MDSLTRDVERIFRKNSIMAYGDIYAEKSLFYKAAKRLFDIMASSVALAVLSPVFLVTAAAILLEDGGPVLFVQPRAGKDMKAFSMYKFRSMYKGADKKFAEMMKKMSSRDMLLRLRMTRGLPG